MDREPNKSFSAPLLHEIRITEPERVRWLVQRYLKRLEVNVRATDASSGWLMCDPQGYVWHVVTPESEPGDFNHPFLVRYTGTLIGEEQS